MILKVQQSIWYLKEILPQCIHQVNKVSLLAFHLHTWTLTQVRNNVGRGVTEDLPEILLVCHIFMQLPASFGVLNSMALILSDLWLAVYSRHDLIPQKNIPPPKTHIFLFIFISSCLFSLHCPYYVAQPHTEFPE